MTRNGNWWLAVSALVVSACGGGGSGTAPPPKPLTVTGEVLYSFGSKSPDAWWPRGVVFQGSDGNFYGVTESGGLPGCGNVGCGTVYKVSSTGDETVLYLFTEASGGATVPAVLIQGNDGNFYGTTYFGGANNLGTVFMLTPGGVETVLYSFKGGSDGAGGQGLIQGSDGNYYGTTYSGGANNFGTVFKLTPQGVETILYAFSGTDQSGPDGANPVGQLVQGSDGNFYGVTYYGGLTCDTLTGCGIVFKVTPDGVETILHQFSAAEGFPNGLIQGSDGNFYGTTNDSNTSAGTVFRVTAEGIYTTLYAFDPTNLSEDGGSPMAPLTQGSDGNFYGTTNLGGKNGGGTMFQVTPAGVVTVLYSFPPAVNGPDTNLVQGSDGSFYGASYYGGTYDRGYFFKLTLSSQ